MFFWLKIFDSEWWFHFFGVPMGIAGAAGVYKTIEKEINYKAGCIVALVLVTTKQYLYYSTFPPIKLMQMLELSSKKCNKFLY